MHRASDLETLTIGTLFLRSIASRYGLCVEWDAVKRNREIPRLQYLDWHFFFLTSKFKSLELWEKRRWKYRVCIHVVRLALRESKGYLCGSTALKKKKGYGKI